MERMEEVIPEADHQALQHLVSESAWAERAVLDPVAQDANRLLGGQADSSSTLSDYRTDLLVKLLPTVGGVGCALAFAMAEFHLSEGLGQGDIPAGQEVVQ